MAHDGEQYATTEPGGRRRIGCWVGVAFLVLILAALAIAWTSRETIADNVIAEALASRGIEASYQIEAIGPREQILRDIVIGDPARPDMTIERAVITIQPRFGLPAVREVRLVKPRIYGRYTGGQLSFGALDPLLFEGEGGPFEFPDIRLAVQDGRALIESDYGPVGIKLQGSGHLRAGFSGEIAATAPHLAYAGCAIDQLTLYGRVGIDSERPQFAGPLRFGGLQCGESRFALAAGGAKLYLRGDRTFAGFDMNAGLGLGALKYDEIRATGLDGTAKITWRDGGLTTRLDLAARGITTPQVRLSRLGFDGSLRTRRGGESVELDGSLAGEGVRTGQALDAALASLNRVGQGNLLGPLTAQMRRQLSIEGRDSRFRADLTLRRADGRTGIVVPAASLRGTSGSILLSISRLQIGLGRAGVLPQLSGNFFTGGQGLPRLAGRMDGSEDGRLALSVSMAPYEAGNARVALPALRVVQRADGSFGFVGELRGSGALPGGDAEGLSVPISGSWAESSGLMLWTTCTDLRFDRLSIANLSLDRRRLTLCPPSNSAIVRYGDAGLKVAAGAPSLAVSGKLGETPVAIRSGPIGFAWPGSFAARDLQIRLGPEGTASRFAISDLAARLGSELAGRFAGADVKLYSVPLDVLGAQGEWRFANGRLDLTDGAFRVEDRQKPERFEPLLARGASLSLKANRIMADAALRAPKSDRVVTQVALTHDLASGTGQATLAVDGLRFDSQLQPDELTDLAKGVVANVSGTVDGSGRILWDEKGVTSDGRFSSEALDLAAMFGPVRGASGTIEFTDLLGLTTAPNQQIHIAAINPGTEVTDGVVSFTLTGGELLQVQRGTWPFFGGTLTMQPVAIRFGAEEERRYVFDIAGLDAALFIQRMNLDNISATGVFDGSVPIVFDKAGNGGIQMGLLAARPPGGNISYVGELTYEDLSPMANYAFAALRSLDYNALQVEMAGPLTGEIVTHLRFDGVSQGEGTKQNFITRRIGKLPIRFVINIRASFYTLLNDLKSLYDPSATDPRSVGILDAQGNPVLGDDGRPRASTAPRTNIGADTAIQPAESEKLP